MPKKKQAERVSLPDFEEVSDLLEYVREMDKKPDGIELAQAMDKIIAGKGKL